MMSDVKMETSTEEQQEGQTLTENGSEDKNAKTEKMETSNGTAESVEVDASQENADYAENEVYKNLRAQNLKADVAVALIQLYEATDLTPEDVDDRVVEMLRSFPVDHAVFIVNQLKEANLIGVINKPQFLMSIMRNFRDKVRQLGTQVGLSQPLLNGPSREKIKEILDRTGYTMEVTTGQRKYGGPPPDWDGPPTGPAGSGHEAKVGKIWDLRIMMDPLACKNRGYAFLTYCDKAHAAEAAKKVKIEGSFENLFWNGFHFDTVISFSGCFLHVILWKFDGYEILPGKNLKVNVSVANTRLFIGNIPKSKSKEEILEEFKQHAEGVTDCIIYSSPDGGENRKNRGFCFLDFCDHKAASDAKRKIQAGKIRPWNSDLVVDWAEQQEEPDEETMSKVKVLYVRNLKEAVTEEQLKEMFSAHGEVDRAKKIRDYAFIHFMEREPALKAMEALNGTVLEGVAIDISLAKPQSEKKRMMRGRGRGFPGPFPGDFSGRGARGRGGSGFVGRGGYGGDYGYGGYDPYGKGYDDVYNYGGAPGYGGYGGYDPYGYPPDPYAYSYGGPPMGMRGRGGLGGGFSGRGAGGRGRGMRGGGRGGPMLRGAKRPGDGVGGPASKREFGGDDFSADINMSSF
uniref:Heterogeneous nuclear ribonucleoprotein Q n=1 Tax=Syphacia muris TaxID=451379 RepID=A0A0N5AGH8_9BILA